MNMAYKIFFCIVCLLLVSAQFIFDAEYFNIFSKPWHMQSFVHEDSLSSFIKDHYKFFDKKKLYPKFVDSSKSVVNILVDAWGLSMDDSLVKQDFAIFESLPHENVVHNRLLNFNTHAEKVEMRNGYENSIYLFGGDSLEYGRMTYIPQLGFSSSLYCQNCTDHEMADKVDSILNANTSTNLPMFIGLTTWSSRGGNRDSLLSSLKIFAELAAMHSGVVFLIQGTHRPILGSPETRRKFYAHWVPAVAINVEDSVK